MSLSSKLVPVQYRAYDYGLLKCVCHAFNLKALLGSLCCVLERHFTPIVLLSIQVYKWEAGNCWDKHTRCIFLYYNYLIYCEKKHIIHTYSIV